jgi:hypothetical protein
MLESRLQPSDGTGSELAKIAPATELQRARHPNPVRIRV